MPTAQVLENLKECLTTKLRKIMKDLIFAALAFTAGVYVEKKYNVSKRVVEELDKISHSGIPLC